MNFSFSPKKLKRLQKMNTKSAFDALELSSFKIKASKHEESSKVPRKLSNDEKLTNNLPEHHSGMDSFSALTPKPIENPLENTPKVEPVEEIDCEILELERKLETPQISRILYMYDFI